MFAVAYYQLTNYASANSQVICKLMVFLRLPSIYLPIYPSISQSINQVCANPILSTQRLSPLKWVEGSRDKACDQLEIKKSTGASHWDE